MNECYPFLHPLTPSHPVYPLQEALVLAEQLLHDRHNISVIPHEVTHVLVVGDLHGDLASLSHIFNHHGPPSNTLAYVFNGDLIDRGTHSSELLFFVASLLELFPHRYTTLCPPTNIPIQTFFTLSLTHFVHLTCTPSPSLFADETLFA